MQSIAEIGIVSIPRQKNDLRTALLDIFNFSVGELTSLAEGTAEGKSADPKALKTLSTLVTKLAGVVTMQEETEIEVSEIEEVKPEEEKPAPLNRVQERLNGHVNGNGNGHAPEPEPPSAGLRTSREDPSKHKGEKKLQCPKCPRQIFGRGPLGAHMKLAHKATLADRKAKVR